MKKKGLFKNILKFITDVISWTCFCLLILIGVCMLWYVVSARIYASRGEKYKPYFTLYTIISPSMEPNIKVYDVILDTRVDDVKNIKEGDVITFISSNSLSSGMTITHRVVQILNTEEGLRFVTKGDNNETPDGALVLPENVLGKTLLRIPALGRVQFLLANKGGWFIIVLLPALGVIIYDFVKLFKMSELKDKIEKSLAKNENEIDPNIKKENEEKRKQELKEKLNNQSRQNELTNLEKDINDEINKDDLDNI